MIERSVENQIKTALKFFPCVTLTGARQTGKTTLLRNILPEYNYITLDLPSNAAMAEETEVDFMVIGSGCHFIESKLTVNAKSDDAKNLKKMSDILSDSKNIPPELQPVSYSIACNRPADYKFSLAPDKEHKLHITVLNVKEAGKTYF